MIVAFTLVSRDPVLRNMMLRQPQDRQAIMNYLMGKNLVVSELFLLVCAIGGYLLVRHLIMKRSPDSNM